MKKEFYEELHRTEANYSGGTYTPEHLVSIRAFSRWAEQWKGRPLNILDVGCGKGIFFRELGRILAARWSVSEGRRTGVDMVRSPGDVFEDISARFEFIVTDVSGRPLPFEDGSFDLVMCNHVLEHVFETEHLLREFRRVVSPQGLCIVSVPNLAAWVNRVLLLMGLQPLGSEVGTESIAYGFRPESARRHLATFRPSGHIRDFTPRALKDMARSVEFETVGWWNQDPLWVFRATAQSGRNVGVLLTPHKRESA